MTESTPPDVSVPQNTLAPAHPPIPTPSEGSTPTSPCSTVVQTPSLRPSMQKSVSSPPDLRKVVFGLAHISPHESQRYEPHTPHDRYRAELNIRPLTLDLYFDDALLPVGYERFVHPDGYPFYFNKDKNLLTNADICIPTIFKKVEATYAAIMNFWDHYYPTRSNNWHLVFENYTNKNTKEQKIGYYFVDASKECLFWLDEYDARDMDDSVKIQSTKAHLGRLMKSQFWYHCEAYPNIYPVTEQILSRVQDTLVNALGDTLTSTDSTIPYGVKTLRDMLDLVKDVKVTIGKPDSSAGTGRVLFRFMASFEHERFRNLYGEAGARLVLGQTIHEKPEKKKRSFMMKMLLLLFFYAPREHLLKLEQITVDHMVNQKSWELLRERLTDDWKEHTLYATVLLNANVAFLAIQSVDALGQSPPQQISYVSVASSIGAIVMGLLLVKQHHTLEIQYLANRSVSVLGLETLSLLYSLPYAFLMWGMITFFLAFTYMCFLKGNTLTSSLMGVAVIVIVMFLLWCISLYWEKELYEHPWLVRKWHSFSAWFKTKRVGGSSKGGEKTV